MAVVIPFITSLVAMILYIVIIIVIIAIVLRLTSDMEAIAIYTGERGLRYQEADGRLIVESMLSQIEVYPITMPSPAVGLKVLVKPAGIIIALILLLLGPLGILIDVVWALLVYDRYNKVARLVEELRI